MNVWRGRSVWIIAALGLVLFAPSVAQAADRNPCNGSDLLCSRTLDQVVLPGTHNSMSAAENNWNLPNQTLSISNQLKEGARSLLFDTHYGALQSNGKVKKIEMDEPASAGAQTFMCHSFCELGAVDLTEEFGRIVTFLAANPREVLVFVNEDYIRPDDFADAVGDSGLLPYVYNGPTTAYPTLGQMIDSGERVVMLSQGDPGDIPWYHDGYQGPMMETPYTFGSAAALTDPAQLDESCRPERGAEGSPLFLMNHWVLDNGFNPLPGNADLVNTKKAVVDRARACETRRGKLPNIIAVDFFGQGDVVGAVRELNGIPDPPPPPPVDPKPKLTVLKPKGLTVKAKRKATFRVSVTNTGDARSGKVKVCATVPSRLAYRARCASVASIPKAGSATLKINLKTKKRFRRGSGQVKFSVFSSQPTLKSAARLTVKPLKKPRKHKRHR